MDPIRSSTFRLSCAVAAFSALLAFGLPAAVAAPATDNMGFVDSTARCTAPDTAAAFGRTDTSRVAICESPDGKYEYRGVRLRDGAKLILAATRSGDDFTAEKDGMSYTVSAASLIVSAGEKVIRDEPMVEFHGPDAPDDTSSSAPATPLPPPLPAEVGG